MRIQRITTLNPTYLEQFYTPERQARVATYAKNHSDLMYDCAGWADYWSVALRKHGIEMDEVAGNARPLQELWARENGVKYTNENWMLDIVSAQVERYKPDVLFFTDYWNFPSAFIRQLRSNIRSIRSVVIWCGAPYRNESVFRECDLVLSCIPDLVEHFRARGLKSELLDHAFEPRILERLQGHTSGQVDFAFMGSIVLQSQFHIERERLLRNLIDQIDIEIWSDMTKISPLQQALFTSKRAAYDLVFALLRAGVPRSLLNSIPIVKKILNWQERPGVPLCVNRRLKHRSHPALFGLEMFQQIRESKAVLNKHIDISANNSSNMRLYEVTGVGSCLITDWKRDVSRNFDPDHEIITYRSPAECLEKVSYLLDHDNVRQQIARAGQLRTLRDHTFDSRAPQLVSAIRSLV